MLNLPLDCMNKGMGVRLGVSIWRIIEVEVQEGDVAWGKSLRVYIELDIRKQLARERTVNVQGEKM